ncbi:MAG TPA: 4-(cytidine 5'-diphospho)-2-C-methyl-D-erythritol kinase [Bacteroidales bacterium]|nr:4-(cytidine 5'-diphospho)-2-C-methyl-D-erythritol kinase [Bacteroidales bacterium]
MIVFPKAKINIGLRITGKRPDGYHDIETLFYPVNLSDALEFVTATDLLNADALTVTGINTGSKTEDNLIMKTVNKLRENYLFPWLRIHLHKAIPVGAGLGGGSSDAACLLKSINRWFELDIDNPTLKTIALELGSDCPFFIDSVPAFATGRGEILQTIKPVLTSYYLLLVNPGISINTREAYSNCKPERPSTTLLDLAELPATEWKKLIINDFEDFAFRKHPIIGEIEEELYSSGALFSSMSGSGSCVYGIFSDKPGIPEKLKNLVIYEGII